MKWKRSKKAQQEAKEKKSTNSSSSSANSSVPSAQSPNVNDYSSTTAKLATNKNADNGILSSTHGNSFHIQKNHTNLVDDHRHIVNLADYSHLDDNVKLSRRPIMFAENNQNGDMFRPYVV